ncbi:MAG: LysR family transcriptional regulator [Alphaproteobacteria bacterium]|nr:LysR family transcriptional regulator [Alphaproteobacteria bacterium]
MNLGKVANSIDWDKLRTFYFIAQAGGFTQASSYLNLAQSTLSRTIQNLENELGFPVFIRHRNGIALTKEGDILFKSAKNIFADIEQAINEIEAERHEPEGSLRIVISGGLLHFFLLPHIPSFAKNYPKINLSFICTDSIPTMDLREADIAVRPKYGERDDLIQRPLLTNHVQLYASPKYLKEFGIPLKPADLDKHRLISFGDHKEAESFQAMNWHLTLGKSEGEVRIPFIQSNTPQSRLFLAEAGLGIVAISAEHPGLSELDLVQVLPDLIGPTAETYLIYSKAHQNSKKIRAFEEYILPIFEKTFGKSTRGLTKKYEKRKNSKAA